MPVFEFEGKAPRIDPTAFIAPTATVVGDVTIEAGASVWYGAVVRADYAPVVIRSRANVQDCAVIHGAPGYVTEIGSGATVAHLVLIHGAVLEEECMVANGSTVLDGARIGARSLVGANSLVSAGMTVPPGMLVVGSPAVVKRALADTAAAELVRLNPGAYADLAQRHRATVREI
jgi:carbonic anhydrase/acetyltransferase-like protein (isoleucine patch superfamily)